MVGMGRDSGGEERGWGKGVWSGLPVWTVGMDREGRGRGEGKARGCGLLWGLTQYLAASTSSLFNINIVSVQIIEKNRFCSFRKFVFKAN